ncbi:phospholipase D-like domain-containing protein [Variovorax saccharolyticus]|uniref:phospholipase D-like domain-containing protein n=1 Tax=Variovorax saccharolyticus TaxID=3053516 RepID=UPI0025778D3E|nr:phospholipase D-like domain-containing protein [Variovorax sp. J31P216]MDM0028880.1 phospholipase D-like domain-containing protein [Variovorax sp. J31P216]
MPGNVLQFASWPTALALGLLALSVILGLVIWSIRRHRDPRLEIDCDAPIGELLPSIAGLSQGTVHEGNAVELLADNAFFEAMFEAIGNATHSVHFETFLWKEGRLGARLADALVDRGRAGVAVRILVDADGGKAMGEETPRRLRAAGCRFHFHHPRHIRNMGVFNDRDHRKLVVLDGRVAFVGGHCIVDGWMCASADRCDDVRDLGVRLEGPAVHAVQAVFAENWIEDSGELFLGDAYFPQLRRAGEVAVHVASIKAEGSPPAVKILHHLVICMARERLWIQNPYFLPDDEAIEALCATARRGVDVRVMVPSAQASDMPMVQHAAHHNFQALLDGGVRIFEYQDCLLHQKVMTVDGAWCAIGSSNFDDRSFETNDEITLGIRDPAMALKLEEVFQRDMQHAVELDAAQWARRGLWHRGKDGFFHVFNELL